MVCCWLRDFFEEAGISCNLATFVCGSDHGCGRRVCGCDQVWQAVFYGPAK